VSKRNPAVSVIIPTYNSSRTLKLSLESVLRQDYQDFEVLVVGDGCTDDSEAVVKSLADPRIHWSNLAENSGTPSAPRNEGLRIARGKFIAYLGHDDLWFPWHLRGLVDLIVQSRADFVYSLGVIIGPEGVLSFFSLPENLNKRHGGVSPSNWLHRKDLTERIGGWPEHYRVGDDKEFLRRVWKNEVRPEFHKKLCVLKFPSMLWQLYSRDHLPQKTFGKVLVQDAAGLRLELLQEFTSALSSRYEGLTRGSAFVKHFQNLIKFAIDLYGRNRWPVKSLLYRRFRRKSGLASRSRR